METDENSRAELIAKARAVAGAFGDEMDEKSGNGLLAKSLKAVGVEVVFFLFGGPMTNAERYLSMEGIKLIDVRHEQAAAMMAHAYSRVTGKPGVCMTGSGADTLNLVTGIANAFLDCAPVVAICGSSDLYQRGMGAFQELDQVGVMKPITKHAYSVGRTERIPAFIEMAFRNSMASRPGPVYVDFPADVLYMSTEMKVDTPRPAMKERPMGDDALVDQAIDILAASSSPIILAGSGILWSQAWTELQEFVEITGIPFYTTPQSRGIVPEDHPLFFPGGRSVAFREADCVFAIGTRANFILGHLLPPRFAADLKLIEVNIDAEELGHNRPVDVGIVGDARAVLQQLTDRVRDQSICSQIVPWVNRLRNEDHERKSAILPLLHSEQRPIHPLRLCRELRDILPRDAILVVDGHETLNFGRQSIPTYCPGHRLNVGPPGCIGIGVPFGIGAKIAKADKPVVVFSGDGSFGMNGMEMDTAIRQNIPITVVINNNGGWTNRLAHDWMPGRDLGFTRYDQMVEAFGGWGEFVEEPSDIRPALERALNSGKPALVNVVTDPDAMSITQNFGGF